VRHSPLIPLVAVAHGSRDPRAALVVEDLLDQVRLARPELDVRSAYLDHAPPTLGRALAGLRAAVVLPLLLTAAYHSRIDIPAALDAATARDPRLRVRQGEPLGPDPRLTAALERRLAESGVAAGDPETAVVLVSAGSSDPRANALVGRIAEDWERRGWWAVRPAYASAASPAPEAAVARLRAAGAPRVVVAPYLLAPGLFADRVRQATLAAGAAVVADVLGAAPELTEILLDRYAAAAQETGVLAVSSSA
jgi:sirohydrochlorin ferrochelatase